MIKAILFDYDGVITKGAENERIFGSLAGNLNVPIEQATDWLMEIWRPYLKGQLSEEEVWEHLESKYGKSIAETKRNIWFNWAELMPLPEMIDLIEKLKKLGLAVGVLSNVFKETAAIIERHDGYESFDFKILSYEHGYAKPDEEIFQLALEKLPGFNPSEVVFLDDREKNTIAADELGMIGIYVTNHLDAIKKVKQLANI